MQANGTYQSIKTTYWTALFHLLQYFTGSVATPPTGLTYTLHHFDLFFRGCRCLSFDWGETGLSVSEREVLLLEPVCQYYSCGESATTLWGFKLTGLSASGGRKD